MLWAPEEPFAVLDVKLTFFALLARVDNSCGFAGHRLTGYASEFLDERIMRVEIFKTWQSESASSVTPRGSVLLLY